MTVTRRHDVALHVYDRHMYQCEILIIGGGPSGLSTALHLARKAEIKGLKIQEGVNVKSVHPMDDYVIVETDQGDFCTKVVGADGSNGITRRCIFSKMPVHTARVLEVLTPAKQVARHCGQSAAYFNQGASYSHRCLY